MKYLYSFLVFSLVFLAAGCSMENYEDVDTDQEHWVYLVQNGTNNGVLSLELDAGALYNGYIGLYCSGLTPAAGDIRATLALDEAKAAAFNALQAESGLGVYEALPEGALKVAASAVIPKGGVSALVPVRIDPVLLQKGKSYLFVLTLQSVSAYRVNPELESLYVSVALK